MERTTYQSLIRSYSHGIADGHYDQDLTPRERRLTSVLLNIASNAAWADVAYIGLTDQTRESTVRYLSDIVWNGGRALVDAVSPASADAFSASLDRALLVLRGI